MRYIALGVAALLSAGCCWSYTQRMPACPTAQQPYSPPHLSDVGLDCERMLSLVGRFIEAQDAQDVAKAHDELVMVGVDAIPWLLDESLKERDAELGDASARALRTILEILPDARAELSPWIRRGSNGHEYIGLRTERSIAGVYGRLGVYWYLSEAELAEKLAYGNCMWQHFGRTLASRGNRGLSRIIAGLHGTNPSVRRLYVSVSEGYIYDDPALLSELEHILLKDGAEPARYQALLAIRGRGAVARASRTIASATSDSSSRIRYDALNALAEEKPPVNVPSRVVLDRFVDPSEGVRVAAIRLAAASVLRDREVVEKLTELVSRDETRVAAAEALGALGGDAASAIPAMERALGSAATWAESDKIERALRRIRSEMLVDPGR